MTRARFAATLGVAFCAATTAGCNPLYYVGTAALSVSDAGDGGDGGMTGPDGGDAGLDGGDGGVDGGNDAGAVPCGDVSDCGCGDYCASPDLDGGFCTSGGPDETCKIDLDCDDEGPGALCLRAVDLDAGCSKGRCFLQVPDGGSCTSDSDCPCASLCAQFDGGAPACVPLPNQPCTGGCGDAGSVCLNLYRGGTVCGQVCSLVDH